MSNNNHNMGGALDDAPNQHRTSFRNNDRGRPRQGQGPNFKQRGKVTTRSLADAITKIVARMDEDSEQASDLRSALMEGAGALLAVANKYERTPITEPVEIVLSQDR